MGLFDGGVVVARIDAYQRCTCRHQLIIGDGHVDNGASDLGADRHRAGIDKGVVGRFVLTRTEPPDQTSYERTYDDNDRNGGDVWMAPHWLACGTHAAAFIRAFVVLLLLVPLWTLLGAGTMFLHFASRTPGSFPIFSPLFFFDECHTAAIPASATLGFNDRAPLWVPAQLIRSRNGVARC